MNDSGIDKAEEFFNLENLYDIDNVALTHYIDNALRANYIMLRDIDYVVSPEQEILIVDQFTGRTMEGRRFQMGSTKPLRLKKVYQSKRKPRLLPQSLTKICSVCTRNCQV